MSSLIARIHALLLTLGWLSSRLGWTPEGMVRHNGGYAGRASARSSSDRCCASCGATTMAPS